MSCPETITQIQRDLAHFPTVDPEKIAVEIPERFGQRQSLCHYTLKDNKVQFVIEICMFVLVIFCFDHLTTTSYIVFIKNHSEDQCNKLYFSLPGLFNYNKHSVIF